MAAIGVSTLAVPVSQGAISPTAPASSAVAVIRTTGIGNGAMPVCPVAISRSRDIDDLAIPEPRKTAASRQLTIQSAISMTTPVVHVAVVDDHCDECFP